MARLRGERALKKLHGVVQTIIERKGSELAQNEQKDEEKRNLLEILLQAPERVDQNTLHDHVLTCIP